LHELVILITLSVNPIAGKENLGLKYSYVRVETSEDCRLAKVYFSVTGTHEDRERSMKGLNSARGFVRKELGRRIRLRYTPEILFQFDPSIEYAIHMGELIESIMQL
jgi:ribosome-binding factor A